MRFAFVLGGCTYQQSLYRVTRDVAQEIERQGHSVDFIFWENPGPLDHNDKYLKIIGLNKENRRSKLFSKIFTAILGKHFYSYIFSPFFARQLERQIGAGNYSAFFFHGMSCIPMRACNSNHYIVVHSCKYENFINRYTGVKKRFYGRLYREIYSHKKLLTVSEDVKKDMLNKVGAAPASIEAIHNGFDFDRLRREMQLPPPEQLPQSYIMAAGRPDRTKRFDILLKAYAKTRRKHPLVIFGEGKRLNDLKQLAKELGISGDVTFAGFCANILPAFHHAKLYVSSSDVEGLPTVIVESLTAGTPVVATDAGGSYELLCGDLSRWIVPRGNVDALARAIDDILENPPAVSSKNIEFLDHRRVARRYIELGEQLKGKTH